MLKSELDTPSLILDLDLFEQNLIKMRDFAAKAGKKLRPHAKTHKCPEIAKRQIAAGNCCGVCAAKLSEAEALAEAGIENILITSPVAAPWKIKRIGALNQKISGLQIVTDHPEQVKLLAEQGTAEKPVHLLVDIDSEMQRTGVPIREAVEFGKYIASFPTLCLDGVQCYAGHLQHIPQYAERARESFRIMSSRAEIFKQLQTNIPSCRIYTGAGTGTSPADLEIPELTDIQVGSYCMMDAEYLAVEHGGPSYPPALRILSSVISANFPGHATIDAGTKSIYVTPGAPPQLWKNGAIDQTAAYNWNFGDEHGKLEFSEERKFVPGERVELVVSHCDPTVNLFDELWIVQGENVVDCWKISLRGCCR